MKQLEALFVVPMNVPDFKGGTGSVPDAIEPPKMARFMLSYLDRRDVPVGLFDANLGNKTPHEVAEHVLVAKPRLVVMPVMGFNPSASTQTMVSAREFAEAIKAVSPTTPIILSGTHPAALPDFTLQTEPAVDYICDGEGPITVHELIQALASGGELSEIRKVRSLWYREDGEVAHNVPAPLLDLDQELAIAGWKFMDPRQYVCHHWHAFYQGLDQRMPYANPFAREGCPHKCSFCNIQAPYRPGERVEQLLGIREPNKNSFRTLDAKLFVDEIQFLVETYGVRQFKIPDEMYGNADSYPAMVATLMKERLGSVCEELNIWCYFRIDSVRPKDLELLRSAGFRWLALGTEAADKKVRSGQDKRFKDEYIYRIVKMVDDAGIDGALNYIFGLPGDTQKTMQETFDLACELNGLYGNFYSTMALPGSELHQIAQASGYPLPERPGGPGWIGYAQYSDKSEPYHEGALTPAEILAFRDAKHREYYERQEWRRMAMSKPHCGQKAIASVDEWMRMIAPENLKRRLLEDVATKTLTM